MGENKDQFAKALRYSFFPDGFQWVFFTFSNGVTLVRFRGIEEDTGSGFPQLVPLDDRTSIVNGNTVYFRGDLWTDYNGEFFCFEGSEFRGVWDEQAFLDRVGTRDDQNDPLQDCSLENLPEGLPLDITPPPPPPPPPPPRSEEEIERAIKALPAINSLLLVGFCEDLIEVPEETVVVGQLEATDSIYSSQFVTGTYADYYRIRASEPKNLEVFLQDFLNFPDNSHMELRRGCNRNGDVIAASVNIPTQPVAVMQSPLLIGDYVLVVTSLTPGALGQYVIITEEIQ